MADFIVHLCDECVLVLDDISEVLHFGIFRADNILKLPNALVSQPDFAVDLPQLCAEIVHLLSLVSQQSAFLSDFSVVEVRVSADPRDFLLGTDDGLVAAGDLPDVGEQFVEQGYLLVDEELVVLHLLLDLRLHAGDVVGSDSDDAGLRDLGLDLLLDLSELDGLAVLVEELRDKSLRQLLQDRPVRLQVLLLDGPTHVHDLALPTPQYLLQVTLQQPRTTLLVLYR